MPCSNGEWRWMVPRQTGKSSARSARMVRYINSSILLAARYVDFRRTNQRSARNFCLEFQPRLARLPLSHERKDMLVAEVLVQFLQEWSERYRVGVAQPKEFASGFFGEL